MKLSKLFSAIAIATVAAASWAQSAPSENVSFKQVDDYRSKTFAGMTFCSIVVETMLLNTESGRDSYGNGLAKVVDCVRSNKEQSQEKLKQALEEVKTPAAKEALKNYHIAFMTALDGLEPGMGERRYAYEVRTQQLRGELQKAWNRFELELKL